MSDATARFNVAQGHEQSTVRRKERETDVEVAKDPEVVDAREKLDVARDALRHAQMAAAAFTARAEAPPPVTRTTPTSTRRVAARLVRVAAQVLPLLLTLLILILILLLSL